MAKDKQQEVSSEEVDVQAAAALVLERERRREQRAAIRQRRRRRRQRKEQLEAIQRMRNSIEVIKWSVVSISTVMLISLVIGIATLIQVNNEVVEIERNVDHVREALRHPMQSLGATFGKELDQKLGALMGVESDED